MKPKVIIGNEVYNKVMHWVNKSTVEVSGLGKVVLEDGNYVVKSAYLLKQENTSATTDIDAEAVAKLLYETREEEGHLNWWWHSHVNMGVFWSGTDQTTIKDFGDQGMCVATVFNKKEETKSAFYQGGTSFYPPVFLDDLDFEIHYPITDSDVEAWDKEFDEKCKTKTWPISTYTGGMSGKTSKTEGTMLWSYATDEMIPIDNWDYHIDSRFCNEGPEVQGKEEATEGNSLLTSDIETITSEEEQEIDNLLEATSPEEFHGSIHPRDLNLRYSAVTAQWTTYEEYMYEEKLEENTLDLLGERVEFIRNFVKFRGRAPWDDSEVDDFYMEMTGTTYSEFYFEQEVQ